MDRIAQPNWYPRIHDSRRLGIPRKYLNEQGVVILRDERPGSRERLIEQHTKPPYINTTI
jgi:hypothetical protein